MVAVLTLFALLVASLGHICEHRPSSSNGPQLAITASASGPINVDLPDGNTLGCHHCAACTGVVLPEAVLAGASDVLTTLAFSSVAPYLHSHGPALHTPPPKLLA